MANQFLVEIHRHLRQQIDLCGRHYQEACDRREEGRCAFFQGRMDELKALQSFIGDSFNLITQEYH